jgi:hypothetical protein
MGQPLRWLPYGSALFLAGADHAGLGGLLGVSHPALNPITGLFAVGGEAYGQWRGITGGAAGIRALASVPFAGFGAGADWRVTSGGVDPIFTFHTALRRSGIFGHGTTLRLDWLPPRHEIDLGVNVPLAQPFAGRTRPRSTVATITVPEVSRPRPSVVAKPFPEAAERALGQLARDASLITAYTNLYTRGDQQTLEDAVNRDGRPGYTDVMRSYDESLASAFNAAILDEGMGAAVAARARATVFDYFILPYDTLFGQVKPTGAAAELLRATRAVFARWLADSSGVPAQSQPVARAVFERWTNLLADVSHGLLARWKDSRLVWLPAQLALSLDQFDEQAEVDSIVGRAAGHSFTDNNELAYLRTADLPLEIARSIMAARRYHVLWTHDFTGRRPSGQLDDIAYTMVADAYLPALTAAVQRYDSTGTMPQFFILLDAFYYHARWGRMWMTVLESPLTASMPLRGNEAKEADHLRDRLTALRNAVAHSARLQRDAAAHGGDAWLNRVVKVNVNVVLPSDFTFRSSRIDPPIPFTPDNVARDHRKLVLSDFTESDPYGGELLVTGIGIGEHYASATWEDRGYRLRGPAALEARAAVRRALRDNGLTAGEIPVTLRDTDPPHGGQPDGNRVARVLHVENEPGFGSKRSSAARAMLYTLAPPGSVIIIPDPLWLGESWAGMVLAAAARGCNVAIITPAIANSPNPEPTVVAREHDVLRDMFAIRQRFAARISAAGGAFHIGIYAAHAPVTDPHARLAEVRAGLARAPWIRALIPFDSAAIVALNNATMQADRTAAGAILAEDERPREPQLHQKTQLIARPGAIAALVRQPGWERILAQTLIAQSRETAHLAEALAAPVPASDTSAVRAADRLLEAYDRSLTAAERKRFSFYFVVGSQNHDTRGLLLDGEANVVVSGFEASAGLVDLFYLMARTTWVETTADIDRLVPSPGGFTSKLARLIRLTM